MDLGRRNVPKATSDSNNTVGGEFSLSSLWAVVLYDGPVIQERALHMLEDMHRQASPRRRLRMDTLPLAVLDDVPVNRHVDWSMQRAHMIVVAMSAAKGLSYPATRHLENYLAADGKNRSLVAFLEGRSPAARKPGYAFDQLQKLAAKGGVDFYAHIADPAPYSATLYVAGVEPHLPAMAAE
ncbi:MAG TPA: hypothetical protein VGH19_24125 [Verrucomicrobiae bacterium]